MRVRVLRASVNDEGGRERRGGMCVCRWMLQPHLRHGEECAVFDQKQINDGQWTGNAVNNIAVVLEVEA